MNDSLSTQAATQLVPAGYAEKAMASLMQLHSELMDEKERRVELFRRLMEREQALAELKMYVKVLEEKLTAAPPPRAEGAGPLPVAPVPPAPLTPPPPPMDARARTVAAVRPPVPPRVGVRLGQDGWRTW
ncbi:MAG: hypothetical protein IT380_05735 [Myxococcales bacterium]|nr:hypothetical protein [Myxococcales bacterium]